MKNFIRTNSKAVLFFLMCTILCEEAFADNSAFAQVRIFNGTVITAWQGQNASTSFSTIEGVIGSTSTDPTTWTRTTLSDSTQNVISSPVIASNSNGDVIVVYEYFDTVNSLSLVAVAMLPSGTTTWNVTTVSDGNTFANNNDPRGAVDQSGNVIATWAAYNPSTNEQQVMCSTSTISATPTWSGPIKLSP